MNKREFIEKLREYLSYELPERLIAGHIDYYSSYIDEQKSSGKTEKEVLAELGDPQLIARSIIDAEKAGSDGIPHTDDDNDFANEIYGSGNRNTEEERTRGAVSGNNRTFVFNGGCLTGAIILAVLIVIIVSIFSFLAPFMAGIAVLMCIMWIIRKLGGGI